MARMHSGKKGKSGSKKPLQKTKQSWLRYKPKEIEMLVLKLAKEGKSASMIGLVLRDSYGIPDVKLVSGKSISKIMEEKKLAPKIPEDLMALIKKSITIRKHMEENRQDMTALLGVQLTESKIKRLVKYYKKAKKLPVDWKYDVKSIKLYAE
ncbi:30S ribosomal protein S15 [Candidatus Woesearchaeota archaeon]|nr:30S ribosomal protein S15 [Candidatus Woesearchaeota archaeon]